MAYIQIKKINETFLQINAEPSIMATMVEFFSFFVPNYRFMKKYKMRLWDGRIRLLNSRTGEIYVGLLQHIKEFAKQHVYEIVYENGIDLDVEEEFSVQEAFDFAKSLNIHVKRQENNKDIYIPINPHDYQLDAFRHAVQTSRSLLLSPTACHPEGTKIVMFDGSIKDVKNINIGDLLMGPDGNSRKVLKLHSGKDQIYKIKPHKGKEFYCNENHILSLIQTNVGNKKYDHYTKSNGCIKNIPLKEYLKQNKTFKHIHKLYYSTNELTFSKCYNKPYILDPYFVGVLLGDGSLLNRTIGVTTIDPEIVSECYHQAEKCGIFIRESKKEKTLAITYFFTTRIKNKKTNPMVSICDSIGILGCNSATKFIPDNYKFANIENRKQILAGLLDTDGYLENGTNYGFCSKSKQLRDDVSFIARSLGLIVTEKTRLNKKYNTNYFYCRIMGDISKIPTRIPRKRKFIKIRKNPSRTGFKIEKTKIDNFYGFTLNKDGLYLLDNFLVTHNSGKSLFIYLLLRHYQPKIKGKILVIVPTVNLVMQMFTDFGEYSYADKWDIREQAHIIYSGKEKNSDKPIIISTWESIYKLGKDYFNQFEVVICDEAHLAKANSLTSIMNKCTKAKYKFGTTGTLDGTKTHKLVLEGLFGRVYKVVSTAELIDRGILSKMDIQCLMLYYSDEICKKMKKSEYQQEITFLVENEARNKFIRNLAVSLTGNTLVLFNLVERHGKILYNLIKEKTGPDRKVFFISGKVEGEIREEFRQITERESDAIIVASYGTFSYGVNIRNLHNVIIASPVKSIIRLLQSIGRGLRKVDGKTLKFFDISDILQYKSWKNHTMKHFMIRMDIYNKEKFNWKLFKIRLKDSSG